jgi:hypothetical protein
MAFTLLGYLSYTIVWSAIWDQTSDSLGGVVLSMESTLAAWYRNGDGADLHRQAQGSRYRFCRAGAFAGQRGSHPKWLV